MVFHTYNEKLNEFRGNTDLDDRWRTWGANQTISRWSLSIWSGNTFVGYLDNLLGLLDWQWNRWDVERTLMGNLAVSRSKYLPFNNPHAPKTDGTTFGDPNSRGATNKAGEIPGLRLDPHSSPLRVNARVTTGPTRLTREAAVTTGSLVGGSYKLVRRIIQPKNIRTGGQTPLNHLIPNVPYIRICDV